MSVLDWLFGLLACGFSVCYGLWVFEMCGWVGYIFADYGCLVGFAVGLLMVGWLYWLFVLGFMLIVLLFVCYTFAYSLSLFGAFGSLEFGYNLRFIAVFVFRLL